MAWPKPEEIAVLTVNGMDFKDWETVMVHHSLYEQPPYICRFTCSEGVPISNNIAVMQIKPGDHCTVTLAGFLAFTGRVQTRQVYYDSNRHYIEIQCATSVELATTSVISNTMEWKKKTFQQIGQDVLSQLGIKLTFEGGAPPSFVFDRINAPPSQSIHDFLDVLARGLSASTGSPISFTTNNAGDFVVAMGPNGGSDSVTEGVDILIGREIIYNPAMGSSNPIIAQSPGSDKLNMDKISHSPFFAQAVQSFGKLSGTGVIINELPIVAMDHMKGRVGNEGGWMEGDQITVFATVYGWLRPSGGLWDRNQSVVVNSPMLIMKGQTLRVKSITFTQDNRTGTRSLLELMNDAALGGLRPAIT